MSLSLVMLLGFVVTSAGAGAFLLLRPSSNRILPRNRKALPTAIRIKNTATVAADSGNSEYQPNEGNTVVASISANKARTLAQAGELVAAGNLSNNSYVFDADGSSNNITTVGDYINGGVDVIGEADGDEETANDSNVIDLTEFLTDVSQFNSEESANSDDKKELAEPEETSGYDEDEDTESSSTATANNTELPFSDKILSFYGIDKGVIANRDGSFSVLLQVEGFDYQSADEYQVAEFNATVANFLESVVTIPGIGASTGISVSFYTDKRWLDLEEEKRRIEKRDQEALKLPENQWVSWFNRVEIGYINQLQAKNSRPNKLTHLIAINITPGAAEQELDQSLNSEEDDKRFEDSLQAYAELQAASSNNKQQQQKKKKERHWLVKFAIQFVNNLVESATQSWDSSSSSKFEFELEEQEGITTHPVPNAVVRLLENKAQIIQDSLRTLGVDSHVLNTLEVGQVLAQHLWLPTLPPGIIMAETSFQIDRIRETIADMQEKARAFGLLNKGANGRSGGNNNTLSRVSKMQVANSLAKRLTTKGWKLNSEGHLDVAGVIAVDSTISLSPYLPKSGDPNGQLDASAFGIVPIIVNKNYIEIGVPEPLKEAFAQIRLEIERFRQIRTQIANDRFTAPYSVYLDDLLINNGLLPHWPRPSYLTTLVSVNWPDTIQAGFALKLLSGNGITCSYNSQIKTVTNETAEATLNRLRYSNQLAGYVWQDERERYRKENDDAATEEVLEEVTAGDANGAALRMVGLRMEVRADSPAQLTKDAQEIMGIFNGQRISVTPVKYKNQQVLGNWSAGPTGVDYISRTRGTGKRTVRNMEIITAATTFSGDIVDVSDGDGPIQGLTDSGGLIRENYAKLLAGHEMLTGSTGSGKSVTTFIQILRTLVYKLFTTVYLIDPQNITKKFATLVGGIVVDLAATNDVRFNFLDRFTIGGEPQVLDDLESVLATAMTLMLDQPIVGNEDTALYNALEKLYLHFEQGTDLIPFIVQSLEARFSEELGFAFDPELRYVWIDTLSDVCDAVAEANNIPPAGGLVVRALRDPDSSGEFYRVRYLVQNKNEDGNGNGGEISESDEGIVLMVLNTKPSSGDRAEYKRNEFNGPDGYSLIEIPPVEFEKIHNRIAKMGLGNLESEALLSYSLTKYLIGPSLGTEEKYAAPRRLSLINEDTIKTPEQVTWLSPTPEMSAEERAKIPGTQLLIESGPVYYEADEWAIQIRADFNDLLEQTGLLDGLNEFTRAIVLRDCAMNLRFGAPILQDLIPLLAAESITGKYMAHNLEKWCNPNQKGKIANGHTNVNFFGKRFVAFNVKNINDKLMPLRMMQVLELIWRAISTNPPGSKREFQVIVDELAVLVSRYPQLLIYVGLLYKRARALNTTIKVLEQNVETFQTLGGKYILNNVGIVSLMRQNQESVEFWASMYPEIITEEDKRRLRTARKGETLTLLLEEGRITKRWITFGANQSLFELLSTKPADVQEYERRRREERRALQTPLDQMLEDVLPQRTIQMRAA